MVAKETEQKRSYLLQPSNNRFTNQVWVCAGWLRVVGNSAPDDIALICPTASRIGSPTWGEFGRFLNLLIPCLPQECFGQNGTCAQYLGVVTILNACGERAWMQVRSSRSQYNRWLDRPITSSTLWVERWYVMVHLVGDS